MKKLILTTAAVLTGLNLYAQSVTFSNFGGNLVNNADSGTLVQLADAVFVELYCYDGATWQVVPNSRTQVGVPVAGVIFSTAALVLPCGNPGDQATLRVAATGENGWMGESAEWTQGTGGAGSPPGPPVSTVPFMPAFSVMVVPEPSAIALGLLGAGALLLLRRRK